MNKDVFPIFKNHPALVYLDNAATTQKPQRVIDSLLNFYSNYNSNVHRGLYPLSDKATEMYEEARKTIAKFINAEPEEIIFTSGTTDGINGIAESLKLSKMISTKPKIILTELEHHSNLLPWQRLNPLEITYIPVSTEDSKITEFDNGKAVKQYEDGHNKYRISTEEHYYPLVGNFDILSFSHISNVTGAVADAKKMVEYARFHNENKDFYTVLDASQSIGHIPIDVKDLDIDFMVFSGHKMYGPMGIGVIYGKKKLLEKMEPFRVGGGMIKEVSRDKATWASLSEKFEAGTPSVADAIALAEAVKFIEEIGFDEIIKHEQNLRRYILEGLRSFEAIEVFHPDLSENASGVISLAIKGVHPHDLAQYLGEKNICVRAGHHCTQILHREVLHIPASLRLSFGMYNSTEDIDAFLIELKKGIEIYSK